MNKRLFKVLIIILTIIVISLAILNIKNIARRIFPLQYREYIIMYSRKYNVDPYLITAIIDVESKFDREAVSPKGAIGLMQILPGTARWIAEQNNMENFQDWMLYDPKTNIMLGAWYVDNLYNQFKDTDLALAAYNGGSGNVSKWLKSDEYSRDGKKLDDIPFQETKDYVDKVKFRLRVYRYLYDLQ